MAKAKKKRNEARGQEQGLLLPRPPSGGGGSYAIRKRGHKAVLVAMTPDEKNQVKGAAGYAGVPMARFIRAAALAAARGTTVEAELQKIA